MTQTLALSARNVQMTYVDKATGDELLAIEQLDLDIPEGAVRLHRRAHRAAASRPS